MLSQDSNTNCYCHFCGSPLRFQISRVGQAVNCFNCGMETILFIPGLGAPYGEEQYAIQTREVNWSTNQLGVRHLCGVAINNSNKNLDWVRIEFILYNQQGLPVGTTSDCKISFPSGESWKFQAPVNQVEALNSSEALLSCEYGRITRLKQASLLTGPSQHSPSTVGSKIGQGG